MMVNNKDNNSYLRLNYNLDNYKSNKSNNNNNKKLFPECIGSYNDNICKINGRILVFLAVKNLSVDINKTYNIYIKNRFINESSFIFYDYKNDCNVIIIKLD